MQLPPEIDYRERLLRLRKRATGIHSAMVNIIGLLIVLPLAAIVYYAMTFIVAFGLLLINLIPGSPFAFGGLENTMTEFFLAAVPGTSWLVALVGSGIVVFLNRRKLVALVDGMHMKRYRMAASYLHHTDFLRVVAEEDFTHIILDRVDDIPALKWISPPRPRTLEQQVLFCACYWNSIIQLSYGPGRLDNASLFNGSWNHLVSRMRPYCCCCCGCTMYSMLAFVLPLAVILTNYHLHRVARLCCIVDYLVEDRFAMEEAASRAAGV